MATSSFSAVSLERTWMALCCLINTPLGVAPRLGFECLLCEARLLASGVGYKIQVFFSSCFLLAGGLSFCLL